VISGAMLGMNAARISSSPAGSFAAFIPSYLYLPSFLATLPT